jgi:hypothetical protein
MAAMAVIKVPKTPKQSFNKDRPASVLLIGQIEHLEWAVMPASRRRLRARRRELTEGQAAERVAQLTKMLPDSTTVPPKKLPPLPPAGSGERGAAAPASGARRRKPTKKARAVKRTPARRRRR